MLKQLFAQAANGFSIKDVPFFVLQISISALLALIIRYYWKKSPLNEDENKFIQYLVPLQVVFTVLAIFSIRSPWLVVLFGFFTLLPLIGNQSFSMRSKVFYILCLFIAFGCGSAGLAVTALVAILIIVPLLHFYKV